MCLAESNDLPSSDPPHNIVEIEDRRQNQEIYDLISTDSQNENIENEDRHQESNDLTSTEHQNENIENEDSLQHQENENTNNNPVTGISYAHQMIRPMMLNCHAMEKRFLKIQI